MIAKIKLTSLKIPAVLAVIAVVSFFATYKLLESPRTFIDEGVFIQMARNFVHYNTFQIQTAPGEFYPSIASSFATTGYTVTYPMVILFKFFGVGLLQARILMAGFIILLAAASFWLMYKIVGYKMALISAVLLSSFAPLYGNGKNVLGEVPGLFFLVLFLLSINKLEETDFKSRLYYIFSGLAAGLTVVTKPIYIILIPAVIISVFFARKRINFNFAGLFYALIAFLIPIVVFYFLYFAEGDSISSVLSFYFYANSEKAGFLTEIQNTIFINLKRFVSEFTPAYFFVLALVWSGYRFLMARLRRPVKLAEETAFVFTVLIGLAYLKIPGAYRYFFPGHVMALLFFPTAFLYCFRFINVRFMRGRVSVILPAVLLAFLTAMQFYQVGFSSWAASYYSSTRSRELRDYFQSAEKDKSFFVYQAAELVTFIPHDNYFQYFAGGTKLFGDRSVLFSAIPDRVVVSRRNYKEAQEYLGAYKQTVSLVGGLYYVFERK